MATKKPSAKKETSEEPVVDATPETLVVKSKEEPKDERILIKYSSKSTRGYAVGYLVNVKGKWMLETREGDIVHTDSVNSFDRL